MANVIIDTTDATYQQLLAGLGTLRTRLRPQVALMRQMTREQQKAIVQRDPLLLESIRFARDLSEVVEEELAE